jgi:WD40 repeat protein
MINFDNYILCLKYNELNNILYFSDNQGNIFSFDINKENIINKEYNKIKKNEFLMENNYLLNSIDISIKGDILIASSNKDIIIIDTTTQKIISTLKGHNDEVIKVKLSLDGKKIISQSLDNTIKIWDIGEEKMTDNLNFIEGISKVIINSKINNNE